MNLIDLLILAILGISVIAGMYKGFLASGLTTGGFIAAFFGAKTLYPKLALAIQSNSSLMNILTYYLDTASMFSTKELANSSVSGAEHNGLLSKALGDISTLPSAIRQAFQSNVGREAYSSLGFNSLSDYLNQTIWMAVINIVSFLILFIAIYLLTVLIVGLINNVLRLPLLRHFDWLIGGAFGLIRGIVIVCLILAIVPMIASVINIDMINQIMSESTLMHMFPSDFTISDIIANTFK